MAEEITNSGPARILVVDDDPDLARTVGHTLDLAGFETALAFSAAEALDWIDRHGLPDLAILDIRMPGVSGIELSERILAVSDLPIVLLSAVDDEPTVVRALERFAEDYVTKPFRPAELVARVKRVLRRFGEGGLTRGVWVRVDDHLEVNFSRKLARVDGSSVSLTPTEAKILHILMRNTGRTVSSEFLLGRVWPLAEIFEDTLRVHIHRLRQKLEVDSKASGHLVTVRGVGYRFESRS